MSLVCVPAIWCVAVLLSSVSACVWPAHSSVESVAWLPRKHALKAVCCICVQILLHLRPQVADGGLSIKVEEVLDNRRLRGT